MFSGFFFFSSSIFFQPALGHNGVHPNLPPAEIYDTIELLNIELDCRHFHVNLALIPIIVKQFLCSDTNCCEFKGLPHDRIDWGGALEMNHMI